MAALHAILQIVLHVVAQIIEPEFVVRAVGDVRAVGGAPLRVIQIVDDHAHRQPQHLVNRAHPLRVAPGQIIVHRDDVHAFARQRIQVSGKRGDERLSFARLHLGDFALVQHDSADQLHVEMPHPQRAPSRFAHQRKRGRHRRLERLLQASLVIGIVALDAFEPLLHFRPQRERRAGDLLVGQLLHFRLERVDRFHQRLDPLHVALVLRPDEARDYAVYNSFNVHVRFLPLSLSGEAIPL